MTYRQLIKVRRIGKELLHNEVKMPQRKVKRKESILFKDVLDQAIYNL